MLKKRDITHIWARFNLVFTLSVVESGQLITTTCEHYLKHRLDESNLIWYIIAPLDVLDARVELSSYS